MASFKFVLLLFILVLIKRRLITDHFQYLLFFVNIAFYYYWAKDGLFVLFLLTLISYFLARILDDSQYKLYFSILFTLSPLLLAKYVETRLFFVGLSFYTFKAISYLIDTYRGKIKWSPSLLAYFNYLSFFPFVLQGPIQKSYEYFNQDNIFKKSRSDEQKLLVLTKIMEGLIIKNMIATPLNSLSHDFLDQPNSIKTNTAFPLMVIYSFALYADFLSYSKLAEGSAEALGIEIKSNFKQPYFAKNIAEFWQRWHRSLNRWFVEYIYIPLGGSREGKLKWYRNILLIFFISGMWHGSSLNFIIWGLLHAMYQIISAITQDFRTKIVYRFKLQNSSFLAILQMLFTFFLVSFAWIFFRISDYSAASLLAKKYLLFFKESWNIQFFKDSLLAIFNTKWQWVRFMVQMFLLFTIDLFNEKKLYERIYKNDTKSIGVLVSLMFLSILSLIVGMKTKQTEFIYFDF